MTGCSLDFWLNQCYDSFGTFRQNWAIWDPKARKAFPVRDSLMSGGA